MRLPPCVRRLLPVCAMLALLLAALPAPAAASTITNGAFQRVWERTDKPVADGQVSRTWMWGPQPISDVLREDYAESPGGQRDVQYFDKSRMEITHPADDQNTIWYVTNGLLVRELISGNMQVGDAQFQLRQPAQVNVAGDPDDAAGPTYATFAGLLDRPALADQATITQRLARDGTVTDDPALAAYGIKAAYRVSVPGIEHEIAQPFWDFMNSSGPVYENGQVATAQLFENPFYATGYPLAEPYWATVRVGGVARDVLMQCFERRCLTYTPANPGGFQTEAGNVGQHYYQWRQGAGGPPPPPPADGVPADGATLYQSSLADWPAFTTEFGSGYAQDGTYHLRNTASDQEYLWRWTGGDSAPNAYGDGSVSVDLRMVSDSTLGYGCLLARAAADANSGDLREEYVFCADGFGGDTGTVSVFHETWDADGNYHFDVLLDYDTPAALRPKQEWNTLKLVIKGDQFWFLVNGDLVGKATFSGPPSGDVGLLVFNGDPQPAEFEFRNLVVKGV